MRQRPPRFTDPKLIEIDEALGQLDPALEAFGLLEGFKLGRGDSDSYHTPHRRLQRRVGDVTHTLKLVVEWSIPEKKERGFDPAMPCTLHLSVTNHACQYAYHTELFKDLPFNEVLQSLPERLTAAKPQVDDCTPEFVRQHGFSYPLK